MATFESYLLQFPYLNRPANVSVSQKMKFTILVIEVYGSYGQ